MSGLLENHIVGFPKRRLKWDLMKRFKSGTVKYEMRGINKYENDYEIRKRKQTYSFVINGD